MTKIITCLDSLPSIQDTVRQFNLNPQKKLGQNFLYDMNITHKIVRCAGNVEKGTVIEIGPGPGGLTRAILYAGATDVRAIDMDERSIHALSPLVDAISPCLQTSLGDASKAPVWKMGNRPRQIIANLPYNVGSHLLLLWLQHIQDFDKLTLMFQKEVAQRITAQAGQPHYGRLAVICNWACHTKIEMHLPPSVFTPPPKVDSAVVSLIPRKTPLHPCALCALEQVTKSAFGQRRKMLRSSLKSLGVDVVYLLEQANIDPTVRAEELSITQFCTLAEIYQNMI